MLYVWVAQEDASVRDYVHLLRSMPASQLCRVDAHTLVRAYVYTNYNKPHPFLSFFFFFSFFSFCFSFFSFSSFFFLFRAFSAVGSGGCACPSAHEPPPQAQLNPGQHELLPPTFAHARRTPAAEEANGERESRRFGHGNGRRQEWHVQGAHGQSKQGTRCALRRIMELNWGSSPQFRFLCTCLLFKYIKNSIRAAWIF